MYNQKYYIDFILNEHIKFVIELDDPLQLIHCCYWVKIFLVCGQEQRLIGDDVLIYYLEILRYQLERALNNELQIHQSIHEDIGILYNKYKMGAAKVIYEKSKEGSKIWVGDRYELWGYGLLTSWIYNTVNGSIMVECSDIYPGIFIESISDEERKHLEPFKKWVQNYKPYFVQEISRDVAQQWLSQAKSLLSTIQENNERDRLMYESSNSVDKS